MKCSVFHFLPEFIQIWHNSKNWFTCGASSLKEYILVIEGSVPPCVVLGSTLTTSLCLLCRQLYRRTGMVRYCRQSGERLGECFLPTTKGGNDPSIINIYSLGILQNSWEFYFRDRLESWTYCGTPMSLETSRWLCAVLAKTDILK